MPTYKLHLRFLCTFAMSLLGNTNCKMLRCSSEPKSIIMALNHNVLSVIWSYFSVQELQRQHLACICKFVDKELIPLMLRHVKVMQKLRRSDLAFMIDRDVSSLEYLTVHHESRSLGYNYDVVCLHTHDTARNRMTPQALHVLTTLLYLPCVHCCTSHFTLLHVWQAFLPEFLLVKKS